MDISMTIHVEDHSSDHWSTGKMTIHMTANMADHMNEYTPSSHQMQHIKIKELSIHKSLSFLGPGNKSFFN